MTYKPLHCWDCGTQVIGGVQGSYVALPTLRQVRFGLADGSYCESPFCEDCAARPWTSERAHAFEHAVNAVEPGNQIRVVSVDGWTKLNSPILVIVEPALQGRA